MNNDDFSQDGFRGVLSRIAIKALREHMIIHWFANLEQIDDYIKEKYDAMIDRNGQGRRIRDYIFCEKMFEIVGPSLLADVDRWVDMGAKKHNLSQFETKELRIYLTITATVFNLSRFKQAEL